MGRAGLAQAACLQAGQRSPPGTCMLLCSFIACCSRENKVAANREASPWRQSSPGGAIRSAFPDCRADSYSSLGSRICAARRQQPQQLVRAIHCVSRRLGGLVHLEPGRDARLGLSRPACMGCQRQGVNGFDTWPHASMDGCPWLLGAYAAGPGWSLQGGMARTCLARHPRLTFWVHPQATCLNPWLPLFCRAGGPPTRRLLHAT